MPDSKPDGGLVAKDVSTTGSVSSGVRQEYLQCRPHSCRAGQMETTAQCGHPLHQACPTAAQGVCATSPIVAHSDGELRTHLLNYDVNA